MDRPLFYRISQPMPLVSTGDMATVKATVAEEIGRILSARCAGKFTGQRNLLNYGLPHPAEGYNEKPDLNALALMVQESVSAFEPRLTNVRVQILAQGQPKQAKFKLSADLYYDGDVEKFTLEL